MPTKSIAFIQAFRGIAALQVVFWHASYYLAAEGYPLFKAGSSMGVSLFFIISGFIMVHVTADNDGSFRYFGEFIVKRATRIWPVWVIALAIYAAVQSAPPSDLTWLLNSLAFIPTAGAAGDHAPVFGFPFLGVGWTLNYEMYFYLFFGACMLFGRWRWAALATWLLLTLAALPLLHGEGSYSVHYMNLMTSPLILMFVSGVVIARVYQSKFAIENRSSLYLMMMAAVVAVVLQYAFSYRTDYGLFNWGLSLIPLVAVFVVASKRVTIAVPAWLLFLGDVSFSLYLLHPIVQKLFDRFSQYFLPTIDWLLLDMIPINWVAFVLIAATSVVTAAVSYRYIERGLCERLKRRLLVLVDAAKNPPLIDEKIGHIRFLAGGGSASAK